VIPRCPSPVRWIASPGFTPCQRVNRWVSLWWPERPPRSGSRQWLRFEDQSWSDEAGPSVDPRLADRIEGEG
jgi:hypothetical protein